MYSVTAFGSRSHRALVPVKCRSIMILLLACLPTFVSLAMCSGNASVNSDVEITVSGSRSESCDPWVR
jgi:hypothetical protein